MKRWEITKRNVCTFVLVHKIYLDCFVWGKMKKNQSLSGKLAFLRKKTDRHSRKFKFWWKNEAFRYSKYL